jgi:hypothetical protein
MILLNIEYFISKQDHERATQKELYSSALKAFMKKKKKITPIVPTHSQTNDTKNTNKSVAVKEADSIALPAISDEENEKLVQEDNFHKNASISSLSSATCGSCSTNALLLKRDDTKTKNETCKIPLDEFLQLQCNKNLCPYDGLCVQKTAINDLAILRQKIWGCFDADAPTASQRKKFIEEILQASYSKHDNTFKFIAGGVPGSN